MSEAFAQAERVARTSYGRLVAILARRWHNLAAAEDALSDAFAAALSSWPTAGVPKNPEGWLLRSGQNRLIDLARHEKVKEKGMDVLLQWVDEDSQAGPLPEERMSVLFACCHPALEPALHAPLILQAVLGFSAEKIACAFLVSPANMSQRLVRGKEKIRLSGIPIEIPPATEYSARLSSVLDAIYAAYGLDWDDVTGEGSVIAESIDLARLVVAELPEQPEARGLLSLMLYSAARLNARRDASGRFVPMMKQNTEKWDRSLIAEAEFQLRQAARYGMLGRYQVEAAIQSARNQQRLTNVENSLAVLLALYEQLWALTPTLGVLVSWAAAVGEMKTPDAGLEMLSTVPENNTLDYQPYWVVQAHLLQKKRSYADAIKAFDRAIGLTKDPGVRDYLLLQRSAAQQ